MNISLTKEFEKYINQKVKSGMYHSASEVIRAALRTFQEHETEKQKQLVSLRKELQKGLDDIKHGRIVDVDLDTFKTEMLKRAARKRKLAA